jgi:hypothetical protein
MTATSEMSILFTLQAPTQTIAHLHCRHPPAVAFLRLASALSRCAGLCNLP